MYVNLKYLLAIGMLVSACASLNVTINYEPLRPYDRLVNNIDKTFHEPRFEHALWGAVIKNLETGEIWYENNADKVFMPASNNKIISASTALLNLGPQFRFTTRLMTNGKAIDSMLYGDLIVWSNGDPTLYEKLYEHSTDQFQAWADSLKAMGIHSILGDIIGDDNAWDDQRIGDGWAHDYLDVWYAAEIGPLQFNENYVDLTIYPPDSTCDTVRIIPNVESGYFRIINALTVMDSGHSDFSVRREYGTNILMAEGTIVRNSRKITWSPTITDPTLFYVTVLKEVLEQNGIQVTGQPKDIDDFLVSQAPITDTLVTHQSAPLSAIIKIMMKRSQNLYAETMVRIQGYELKGIGSFDSGCAVVQETLSKMGIQPETYIFADGSGLTRYDYVSPRILLTILNYMRYNSDWDLWYDSLPIAGVDGTLKNRMQDSPGFGNVRAKTGTISNVRGLSGYVTTADDQLLAFSFLVNGHLLSSADTEEVTDHVLDLLARYREKQQPTSRHKE